MLISPFPKPSVTPPAEHPRLMLRRFDLPRVRQNMEVPRCRLALELWQELCRKEIRCLGATPEYGTYDLSEYISIEAKALNALLSGDETDARTVIRELLFLLERSDYTKGIMKARWSGHLIFTAAQVYDWCYAFLTEDEKQFIISTCEHYAESYFEMGYPPAKQAALSGHGTEAQLLRDLLALGIAVYDERPDIYDYCAGRILEEYVPACRFQFAGGFHPQGPSYGAYRYSCLLWAALLFYTMDGQRVFDESLQNLADSFFYMTRPDGEAVRLGDDFCELKAPYTRNAPFAVPMFFAAAYTGNRRYYGVFEDGQDREYLLPTHCGRDYYTGGSYGEGLLSPSVLLIWNGLTPEYTPEALPAYRYFGSPVGLTVWKDCDRYVLMKIGELWGANHDHLDTGCFQVYCRGSLASDSGVYDSYNTDHRKFYTIRTSAHNCLTVSDPDKPDYGEWLPGTPYDGGTRKPCRGSEPKTLEQWQQNYRMAKVLSRAESDTLCEVVGDLTQAYCHTCNQVIRAMRWEPRKGEMGTLTVSDRVEAKSDRYTAAFHLHCQAEPQVCGNTVILSNETAKLVCRVLSPENPEISVIGGEGRQFVVDGANYDTDRKENTEAGWGQVIISPVQQTAITEFLVEMELQENI